MTPEWTPPRSILVRHKLCSLGQFGDELQVFRLRPCATSTGVHIALRAEPQREFDDIVAVRRIDESYEITVASSKINLLDLNRSEERRVGKECRSRWSPH